MLYPVTYTFRTGSSCTCLKSRNRIALGTQFGQMNTEDGIMIQSSNFVPFSEQMERSKYEYYQPCSLLIWDYSADVLLALASISKKMSYNFFWFGMCCRQMLWFTILCWSSSISRSVCWRSITVKALALYIWQAVFTATAFFMLCVWVCDL